MRQHDRVGLGVRQVEAATEDVAELVVQRHADGAEHRAAEPCTVERRAARLGIAGAAAILGSASAARAMPVGHQRRDRVAVPGVERLDRVGHGVEAAVPTSPPGGRG